MISEAVLALGVRAELYRSVGLRHVCAAAPRIPRESATFVTVRNPKLTAPSSKKAIETAPSPVRHSQKPETNGAVTQESNRNGIVVCSDEGHVVCVAAVRIVNPLCCLPAGRSLCAAAYLRSISPSPACISAVLCCL